MLDNNQVHLTHCHDNTVLTVVQGFLVALYHVYSDVFIHSILLVGMFLE